MKEVGEANTEDQNANQVRFKLNSIPPHNLLDLALEYIDSLESSPLVQVGSSDFMVKSEPCHSRNYDDSRECMSTLTRNSTMCGLLLKNIPVPGRYTPEN